jgi:choline monooxygenase
MIFVFIYLVDYNISSCITCSLYKYVYVSWCQGWTYGLDGKLQKATRITGIRNFNINVSFFLRLHAWYYFFSWGQNQISLWIICCHIGGKQEFGLKPIKVATWGPFVLIRLNNDAISYEERNEEGVGDDWLGSAYHLLSSNGIDTSLMHVCRRDYTINCNWKVQFFLRG